MDVYFHIRDSWTRTCNLYKYACYSQIAYSLMQTSAINTTNSKLTMESKLFFLKLVLQRKNFLFASFSSTITKEKKVQAWRDIDAECSAMGLNIRPYDKDFTYLRDTVWPNCRRATIVSFLCTYFV